MLLQCQQHRPKLLKTETNTNLTFPKNIFFVFFVFFDSLTLWYPLPRLQVGDGLKMWPGALSYDFFSLSHRGGIPPRIERKQYIFQLRSRRSRSKTIFPLMWLKNVFSLTYRYNLKTLSCINFRDRGYFPGDPTPLRRFSRRWPEFRDNFWSKTSGFDDEKSWKFRIF